MILVLKSGVELSLHGQFGTAKRKLAEGEGLTPEDLVELQTEGESRLVLAPKDANWDYLVEK